MKSISFPFALLAICLCLFYAKTSVADTTKDTPRTVENFDAGWKFHKGDVEGGAEAFDFDDSKWRKLDLPHDWSVEGPFDENAPSESSGAYLPCGIGWYRKAFKLDDFDRKKVYVEFDSIYMNGEVWINGHRLGKRPYGYLGVQYDLTPYLKSDAENVIAVRVDNSLQPSSRWYTGSGIYRHVWLTIADKLHVAHNGTFVQTPEVSTKRAKVNVQTEVRNDYDTSKRISLSNRVFDENGRLVTAYTTEFNAPANETSKRSQTMTLPKPKLWSPESPSLYTMRTEIRSGKNIVDRYETTFGVRTFKFDPKEGFILNGKHVILKGMCNHHDLGPLGAALWDEALRRRLILLREMGCNSIRTAHNPPSPELLDMCDEMGILVIDETFDEWREGWGFEDGRLVCGTGRKGKAEQGYHLYFEDWAEKDLTDHIVRDRNHPCVIMWSLGNEVPEAQVYGDPETLKKLVEITRRLDPTRPTTVGCNQMSGVNESGFAEFMDVVGYNGGGGSCFQYEQDHERYPNRCFYASEVPHSWQTRSEYRTHSHYREKKHQPPNLTEKEVFPETKRAYESSYDNAGVRISARDSWRLTRDLSYVAGEYRWTGFDYLGESGAWPRVVGNFGIIDICNFPKDTYFFYQSQWTDKPMVHLLPHWTWPGKEGTVIPVWCYTNCDEVELFLNGESLGTKTFTPESDMHLSWDVPYRPGELKAVAKKDGKITCTTVTRTAGKPAKISISADQDKIIAGSRGLSYVKIEVLDKDGTFDATAETPVELELEGPGRILAVGNGDPLSIQSFQSDKIETFNGLALAIIAVTDEPGEIVLTARSKGLAGDKATIQVVEAERTSR